MHGKKPLNNLYDKYSNKNRVWNYKRKHKVHYRRKLIIARIAIPFLTFISLLYHSTSEETLNNKCHKNLWRTSSLADRVRLPAVLCDLIVDEADNVRPDGSLEHGREADRRLGRVALLEDDRDQRSCRGQRLKKEIKELIKILSRWTWNVNNTFTCTCISKNRFIRMKNE